MKKKACRHIHAPAVILPRTICNGIVVSDPHCGCKLGLFPSDLDIQLDEGSGYVPNPLQKKMWEWWQFFWNVWVPEATRGEPYWVCVNGDSTDGIHHNSVTQVTANLVDQKRICEAVFKPVVDLCEGRFYMTRGTEAHVGPSGQNEEDIAKTLGAIPNSSGQYARYELWIRAGEGLCHIMHHIGTSGRAAYETSAVMAELAEEYNEAGRWQRSPPDVVVRSHRHRFIEIRVPTHRGYGIAFTTAGWQGKTPFAWKIPGARNATPQFGGHLIRHGDRDLFTMHKVWNVERSPVEEPQDIAYAHGR